MSCTASSTRQQYAGVLVGVERGHRQFADAAQQADGEDVLTRNLREVREFLAGDGGRQRVTPECTVIESRALTALVAVHHREADHQVADLERSERDDRALQRDDRPRAAKSGGVGELEQAPGDGRIGLHQPHQFRSRTSSGTRKSSRCNNLMIEKATPFGDGSLPVAFIE